MHEFWLWAEQVVFYLAIFDLAFALIATGLIVHAGYAIPRLAVQPIPQFDEWPSVSLIAPARNEERNMEAAVRSLVKLAYPRLELTIVNDRSTDGTGQILDSLAAEFPQLNVVHLASLPAGWLGKNHALQLGADRSHGDWLLFADADIIFDPTVLQRAIGYALANQVDHLTITPDSRMPSWFLQSFVVTFAAYFTLFTRIWAVSNPKSQAHVGIGAFNLIRGDVYRSIGGHQRIRMRPDDDLKLGKIIKLAGFRQHLLHGTGLIVVEWYHSFREMVRGLEKNLFSGTDYSVFLTVFSSCLSLLVNVWPYLAVFIVAAPARWIYLATACVLWFMAWFLARGMNVNPSCALAFPLTVLALVYMQWRTMLLNFYHNGIRWRDTHYSLAELRANKV